MSTSILPPQQYTQSSRKGKRAWRKNVDLSGVQEGLENVRLELRDGGVIAEKPSDELFALDTTGSADIQKTYRKTHKPLTADQILSQRSAIPAVVSHKRPASKVTDGVIERSSAPKKPKISRAELERLRTIAFGGEAAKQEAVKAEQDLDHDPWADKEQPLPEDPRFSFLEPARPVLPPRTLKHAPVTLAASGKPFPAVRKPDAGRSYNPTFEDWDALIAREGSKEVEAEKKRLRQAEEERELAARVERAAAEAEAQAAVEGRESDWESEWEGIQSEVDSEGPRQRKMPERKTKAQRNRIKRRKEAEREALAAAKLKHKEQQAAQIKALARDFEERIKVRTQSQALQSLGDANASSDEGEEELRRQRFGKIHIPDAPLEIVLADELQDSLRLLKPEGNMLNDRFRSILLRGKVEARRPVAHRKKAKVKVTEKWSYKDWKLQ